MTPGVHLGSLRTAVIGIFGRADWVTGVWKYPRIAAPVFNRCAAPAWGTGLMHQIGARERTSLLF
jgi:hypothetical protein